MSKYDSVIDRDGNYQVIPGGLPFKSVKTITFAATADGIGDYDGALATFPIFTVTGDVMVWVLGVCKTALVSTGGTIEVGIAGNTAILIPQATASDIAVNIGWHDATPALGEGFTPQWHTIGGGLDINGKLGTADISAGVIDFYCFWRPLSSDGLVA